MADPLSITASIVGIIGVTGQGVGLLSDTIQNIRHAPESIRTIQTGLHQLKPLLSKLELAITEEPADLILCPEIRDALAVCNRACTEFSVSLTHWTRHSSDEKTSLLDNAKIGILRQGRIRSLNEQLNQGIKMLNVTLETANYLKISRQQAMPKEVGDQMLVLLESRLNERVSEACSDRNALAILEEPILSLKGSDDKQALLDEMKRQKSMIHAVQRISEEALRAAVSERTKQKIDGVKANNRSIALSGFFNVGVSERNRDQDISNVYANERSISIAGVANNIDINSMHARVATSQRTETAQSSNSRPQTVIDEEGLSWEI